MKQKLIGIDECNSGGAIGSMVYALVGTDQETLDKITQKYSFTKSIKLKEDKVKEIVHYAVSLDVEYDIIKVPAYSLSSTKCHLSLRCKAIAKLLNSTYRFWEQKVYIDNFCTSKKIFLDYLTPRMPANLKKDKLERLIVSSKAESKFKIVALADIFARYFFIKEKKQNKLIYGIGETEPEKIEVIKYFYDNFNKPTPIMNTSIKLYKDMYSDKKRKAYKRLIEEWEKIK